MGPYEGVILTHSHHFFSTCEDCGCVNNHYLTLGRKWHIMKVYDVQIFHFLIVVGFHQFNLLDVPISFPILEFNLFI